VIRPFFAIDRTDVVHREVQQAIRPESIALIIFAVFAAVAMIVLAGQGLAQMISRSSADLAAIRALGATRGQATLAASLPGLLPVLGGAALAVAGAITLSPLAPVGPVRQFDPDRGIHADWLVLGPGTLLLLVILVGLLAALAAHSTRPRPQPSTRSSVIARGAARAGLPPSAVVGSRNALEPGSGVRSVPVRSALLGSVAAVSAVVAALTFDASLAGLASHPARYGWNSDVVIQAEGGYAPFSQGKLSRLINGQAAVAGWSEFGFTQPPVGGHTVPVLGIRHQLGAVQPSTTTGRPLSRMDQIELGQVTLNELGKQVGDTVRIGLPGSERTVTITGTVTLPSFGQSTSDHVSLGRGAMLSESTLLSAEGVPTRQSRNSAAEAGPVFPTAVAIDLKPGTTNVQRARLVRAVIAWQTTLTLTAAVIVGGPLGVVAGRWAWRAFANSLGIAPVTEIPALALVLGLLALVAAGNLLAADPAAIAARTPPAAALRAE
jgi:hypothetical protein